MTNEELLANAGFVADCGDTSKTREMLGERYDIHPSRAQRLRIRVAAADPSTANSPDAPVSDALSAKSEETADGISFSNVQTTEPLTDWTAVFEQFNLDPERFIIGVSSLALTGAVLIFNR